MKITVKTTMIELAVEDHVVLGTDNYPARSLAPTIEAVQGVITEAIRLHNEVAKGYEVK